MKYVYIYIYIYINLQTLKFKYICLTCHLFAFQGFSQGFEYEHMVEEHDVPQSQEANMSLPLDNVESDTESIQPPVPVMPNPTSVPQTMDSLLQHPFCKDSRLSALQSNLLLLNLQTLHQWSNESMNDLLR